jgi:hypothetical protein
MDSLLNMGMGKQVILAIFIITVTLGAKAKLQLRVRQLCPTTDCTFMAGHRTCAGAAAAAIISKGLLLSPVHLPSVGLPPVHLPGIYIAIIPGG